MLCSMSTWFSKPLITLSNWVRRGYDGAVEAADCADGVHVFVDLLFLVAHFCEGVDDHAEKHVQENDVDDDVDCDVVEPAEEVVQFVREGDADHHISDTTGRPRTERHDVEEALYHGRAGVLAVLYVAHVEVFGEVLEADDCVTEDDADSKRSGQ